MLLKDLFVFLPKSKRSASYGKLEGKYPFFTSSNTINKYVDEPDYNGSYLIIGDGGTGNCKYYDGEFSASDHNYIMFPKKGTNPHCVQYFLAKDNFQVLNEGFKGIGIKNVSKAYIENIDYRHNQKFSEDYICQTLVKIEELINKELSVLTLLDELTKSRFIEMFRPIQYMYDSDYSIGDVCEVNPKKDSLDDNIEITFIPMEKVGTDGSLKLDSLRKYGDIKKGFSQIKENDVLFAKITPCMENGKATIAKGLINGYAGGTTELFVIRCGDKVLPEYLFHIVHSQYFRDKAKPNMRGTVGQQRVGKDFIESFHIDVPDLKRQKEFSIFVKQVDKLKFNAQKRIDLYQELLNKKMDEYFN